MASSGQAWQDELQSFLPHALDCVDPNCLRPLCVNLKLTLRHVQICEKLEQCTICQGMKTLAASHSNSCRDYYCRVPFCMEAKVTTQQQILMDELVKTSPGADVNGQDNNDLHIKEANEKRRHDDASTKADDSTLMLATTPGELTKVSGEGCADKASSSDQGVLRTVAAKYPPPDSKIVSQVPVSIGKTVQPEWTEQSHFKPIVDSPKRFQPSSQKPLQGGLSDDSGTRTILPSKTTKDPLKSHCQPGTKRKLQSFVSSDKSTPSSKVYRTASGEKSAHGDGCPDIEILESQTSGDITFKLNDAPTPKYDQNAHKRKQSKAEMLPKTSSKHVVSNLNRKRGRLTPTPLHLVGSVKSSPSLKTSSLRSKSTSHVTKEPMKDVTWSTMHRDSSGVNILPVFQVVDQITDDSVDCYIDEMFSTPPPSPTFEMWFGETVRTNESLLKSVLLDTLFQLLGIVTQPKTKQQEALFVDLLERTLRVMKTEIAKQ